jgi:C4-dicarboxylate-specific signal transduction histidine kinase
LREAQTELAHVNRVTTMGQLTASIAHEVNQPLSGREPRRQAGDEAPLLGLKPE